MTQGYWECEIMYTVSSISQVLIYLTLWLIQADKFCKINSNPDKEKNGANANKKIAHLLGPVALSCENMFLM